MSTVTVSPWTALDHLFRRWQSLAANTGPPSQFADDLIAFFRKHRGLAIASACVLSTVLGAYSMYRFMGSDIPALRAEFQKMATELYALRSDLNVAEVQQRSDLKDHVTQEKASRDALASSLRALRVHSILLAPKVEGRQLRTQEVKDVLSSVKEISIAEASKLESIAPVGGVIPDEYAPLLAFAKREEDLKEFAGFFSPATPSVQPAYVGKLLLTRHGTWHAQDHHLLFKWDGGSAKFRAMQEVPQSELVRTAELFNSVSLAASQAAPPAVHQTVVAAPRNYAPRPKPAPRANGPSLAQRRPHAAQRIEVARPPETASRRSPAPAP